MELSVVLPDPLGQTLERSLVAEQKTASEVVTEALDRYFRQRAAEAIREAAAAAPMSSGELSHALAALQEARDHSDRL